MALPIKAFLPVRSAIKENFMVSRSDYVAQRTLPTENCQCGDILAEDIYNNYGSAITVKNTAINPFIKQKLISMGISRVRVYDSSRETFKLKDMGSKKIAEDYKVYVSTFKEIVYELSIKGKLNFRKLNTICDSLLSHIKEAGHAIRFLSKIKKYDDYTYNHSINVAFYSMLIAKWMKLPEDERRDVVLSGLLHDIGKTKIPIHILNKKAALLSDEYDEMKKHSVYGYNILKASGRVAGEVCRAVLLHHEREDGSGYPFGIRGTHINKFAKIIAITDVYDAMISNRVYKKAVCPFNAFEMFYTDGLKSFDINILMTFTKNISPYFISSKVFLNDGVLGEIVYIPPSDITKPVIRTGTGFIDLSRDSDNKVIGMAN